MVESGGDPAAGQGEPAAGDPWAGAYKIPWQDPAFSRRMLAEHLSQAHDLASRRLAWIDRQVAWIDETVLGGRPADILDLGCGPGLYCHRLAERGHRCRGIDFGPAAIAHAQDHNPAPARCRFQLGDLRATPFGGSYDLALLLYGEFNVFSPAEALAILGRARESLAPRRGRLLLEIQAPAAVEAAGKEPPGERRLASGLFCEGPHVCRVASRWLEAQAVAVQTYTITEAATGRVTVYRSTSRAWGEGELAALLARAGFGPPSCRPDWPCNTTSLALWTAEAG